MSTYFTAPDGSGDDTIWLDRSRAELEPYAVMRECDLSPASRQFWPLIVEAFLNGDTE